jgi:hypothetical protein
MESLILPSFTESVRNIEQYLELLRSSGWNIPLSTGIKIINTLNRSVESIKKNDNSYDNEWKHLLHNTVQEKLTNTPLITPVYIFTPNLSQKGECNGEKSLSICGKHFSNIKTNDTYKYRENGRINNNDDYNDNINNYGNNHNDKNHYNNYNKNILNMKTDLSYTYGKNNKNSNINDYEIDKKKPRFENEFNKFENNENFDTNKVDDDILLNKILSKKMAIFDDYDDINNDDCVYKVLSSFDEEKRCNDRINALLKQFLE